MNDSASPFSRRADVFAVLFALVFPALITWLYFVVLAGHAARVQHVAYGICKVIQFGFPVVWVVAMQRRRLRFQRPGTKGLVVSFVFGLLVAAAMLLMYRWWLKPAGYLVTAEEEVRQKVAGLGLDTAIKYFALGAFYAVCHSFLEEYYWRWFVFGQLRRLVALWPAVLISSLGFMAHHVIVLGTFFQWAPLPTGVFSLAVAAGGGVWAWIYARSDSLYGPWLSHAVVDAGIFLMGYYMVRVLFG